MDTYPALTCLTCRVAFADLGLGREHYKSEWHRYNLKRKVAQMEPLSAEVFRIQASAKQEQEAEERDPEKAFCEVCIKPFHSHNALESHLRSKKHLKVAEKGDGKSRSSHSSDKSEPAEATQISYEEEDPELESWDDEQLGLEQCLFCPHIAKNVEDNLQHMTKQHSFFIPDIEYVDDIEGLIDFLGKHISQYHMCLWCNHGVVGQPSRFLSIRDVQKHMVDKGHCKFMYDESTQYQYADFYDYRSSYPDADEVEQGRDESVDPEVLVSSGFELVLPSGATIGHRSLVSYYKQNMGRRHATKKTKLHSILAGYRALGWTGNTDVSLLRQRAKDIHYLQRMKNRFHIKIGMKNNMQQHYREQNPK